MHSLYSIADIGNGPELLKMYIEEMNNPRSIATSKRSYQLQNIEKYQMSGQSSPTWTSSLVPSTGTVKTVADLFAVVKRKDSNFKPKQVSQIVNEDGTPKIIYHQTGKEFHVFSNANPLSGMNDSETPNGFFAKDNDADIGIGGKKQMALYGDMKKPLHFKNRAEARAWYEKHVDGYAALQKQHDQINLQFQEEYEQQETDSDKYYEENYNAYVANDPAVTNAILENEKKLDDILDGWKAASVSISRQQRELLNEYFLKHDSGYDGIILDVDEGQNGETVKSYIFFNNTQLKSATGNIGTFDKANQDIRHSSRNSVQSSTPYSYDSFISKPDMSVTTLDSQVPSSRADVIAQAKQNAAKIGKINAKDGSVSVHVKDIGRDVVLSTNGLKHSLDRRFNVNAAVVQKAGEIINNSIRINEMIPQKADAKESYVLIGAARNNNGDTYIVRSVVNGFSNELASMDILYAINAKKEPAALLPRLANKSAIRTDSTISISELLDYVNEYFPDILPEDVLKHYGHDARPDGVLGESALYSSRNPQKQLEAWETENERTKPNEDVLKSRQYTYQAFAEKPDMNVTQVSEPQNISRGQIIQAALASATAAGFIDESISKEVL